MQLASKLEFNFSQTFQGVIWQLLKVPELPVLLLEIREEDKHEVRFAAFDYTLGRFLWKDILFEETWWIGQVAATADILLLNLYLNMENPDEKGLMAFHIHQKKILWRYDYFSFSYVKGDVVVGHFAKDEFKATILDVNSGKILENDNVKSGRDENITVINPFQYVESNPHFETVKSYLTAEGSVVPLFGVDYLEYEGLVFISYYIQEHSLANYLIVITEKGETVLREKLGEALKGIGLETFFILAGCLFFVRNKCELVSFRIV